MFLTTYFPFSSCSVNVVAISVDTGHCRSMRDEHSSVNFTSFLLLGRKRRLNGRLHPLTISALGGLKLCECITMTILNVMEF